MNKALKITGAALLALALVLNLEYAVFSGDVSKTSNKAFADWWSGGVHYCNSSPYDYAVTGYWVQHPTNDYYLNPSYPNPHYDNSGYEYGFDRFVPDNNGYECGPANNQYPSGSNSTPGWTDPYANFYSTSWGNGGGWGTY